MTQAPTAAIPAIINALADLGIEAYGWSGDGPDGPCHQIHIDMPAEHQPRTDVQSVTAFWDADLGWTFREHVDRSGSDSMLDADNPDDPSSIAAYLKAVIAGDIDTFRPLPTWERA